MTVTLTILGCGSSGGVPRIGNHWGACDPLEPRNRRRRCSVMLERRGNEGATRVLIDTAPDLRQQLLDYGSGMLDAVLFTHEHADHTHGIDELRAVAINMRQRVPIWANDRTGTMLLGRFGYCFYTPPGSDYPPTLRMHRLTPDAPVVIDGQGGAIAARAFEVTHGTIRALGFRVGDVAYTPDLNGVPDDSLAALSGLDTWIVDALRTTPHPSHFSLPETLEWIDRLKPRRAILTNLHIDLDYATLAATLPEGIEPAYDGLKVEIDV
jgi:phosphoribosyl 1,2-cyclic phosphate phosphodiesterase